MFPQRPMPPMNSRGFIPGQGNTSMGRQPFLGPHIGSRQFGSQIPTRGGGLKGLLSRIIPGSQGAGAVNPQGFIQSASGASRATGALQGLTNPANISSMLGNVQKVLGVAQQVTPMVQQYGPLVKNLPAMIKIYRELKNSDNDDEAGTTNDATKPDKEVKTTTEETPTASKQKQKKRTSTDEQATTITEAETTTEKKKRSSAPRGSKPKMYI